MVLEMVPSLLLLMEKRLTLTILCQYWCSYSAHGSTIVIIDDGYKVVLDNTVPMVVLITIV